MSRRPNTVGGGSNTNFNGLSFEDRTNLLESMEAHRDICYSKKDNMTEIFFKNTSIGFYFEKHDFYKNFLEKRFEINYKEINSKKYLPDAVFVNDKNKTVYIMEKKYQEGSGSVDEKLQTCDFKKKVFSKLLKETGYDIQYYYLLNNYFEKKEYDAVKKYIESIGCKYFFDDIPFRDIGIDS